MHLKVKKSLRIVLIVLMVFSTLARIEHVGASTPNPNENVILKAMEDELNRSMNNLGKDGSPAPYFIQYRVTDTNAVTISAFNGALENSNNYHSRYLDTTVRVGDHKLDNFHAIRGGRGGLNYNYSQPVTISLEDNPKAIRQALWLETDSNYKNAVERLIQIKANQDVTVSEEDKSDDFSIETPVRDIQTPSDITVDIKTWEKKVKDFSAIFVEFPEIYASQVSLQAGSENKYLANSEGSLLLHGRTQWTLFIAAGTRAEDGMTLGKVKKFDSYTSQGLPDDETIIKSIKALANDLMALRKAPLMEPYTGPAILSGEASAVFFHEIFGHRIEGHRQKDENEGQTFTGKLNQLVLPPFISVYDDPTLSIYKNKDLNGHYLYDDEGVKAERVNLIKDGILKNFLMSRSPIEGFPNSNGHGRAQAGFSPVSRQGTLIVDSSQVSTMPQLRKALIDECKKQGKPFGLYFDDISGGSTHTMRFSAQAFDVIPTMVYRVYVDGRPDELVRGVNLIGTPLTSFSKILACGGDTGVFNGYCGAESGSIPASAISPAILTGQIEVQKRMKESDKIPILAPPKENEPIHDNNDLLKGENDPILYAMKDELDRSMNQLKMDNTQKPYYIGYTISDRSRFSAFGTLGALLYSGTSRQRLLKVDLRVGDYQFDNSGSRRDWGSYQDGDFVVIEDNYKAIRHRIWLKTDDAYKQAVETLAEKHAQLKNLVQSESFPDFTKAEPIRLIEPRKEISIDQKRWENLVRKLSGIFRDYPMIYDSSVELSIQTENRFFVNSEGILFRQPQQIVSLQAVVTTQAPDGMRLTHYYPFYTSSIEHLPDEPELEKKIHNLGDELIQLVSAPKLDNYIGPVLFSSQASCDLFTQVLTPYLSGERAPGDDPSRLIDYSSASKLARRLDRRILPDTLSIIDDPTRKTFNHIPLLGTYAIDDEGVIAKPVTLIEKGILKTLLMARRPSKEISLSNGHGRAPFSGSPGVQIANLIITSDKGKPYIELKKELMRMCREQKLPFGLLVKTLDNPSITGSNFSMSASLANSAQTNGLLTAPVLLYKIDSNTGKEDPIRGLIISEMDVKDLRYLAGLGNDYYVQNRIMPPGGSMISNIFLYDMGSTTGIPASIVSPSVLLEEVEFKKNSDNRAKPPILPPPDLK